MPPISESLLKREGHTPYLTTGDLLPVSHLKVLSFKENIPFDKVYTYVIHWLCDSLPPMELDLFNKNQQGLQIEMIS